MLCFFWGWQRFIFSSRVFHFYLIVGCCQLLASLRKPCLKILSSLAELSHLENCVFKRGDEDFLSIWYILVHVWKTTFEYKCFQPMKRSSKSYRIRLIVVGVKLRVRANYRCTPAVYKMSRNDPKLGSKIVAFSWTHVDSRNSPV